MQIVELLKLCQSQTQLQPAVFIPGSGKLVTFTRVWTIIDLYKYILFANLCIKLTGLQKINTTIPLNYHQFSYIIWQHLLEDPFKNLFVLLVNLHFAFILYTSLMFIQLFFQCLDNFLFCWLFMVWINRNYALLEKCF